MCAVLLSVGACGGSQQPSAVGGERQELTNVTCNAGSVSSCAGVTTYDVCSADGTSYCQPDSVGSSSPTCACVTIAVCGRDSATSCANLNVNSSCRLSNGTLARCSEADTFPPADVAPDCVCGQPN